MLTTVATGPGRGDAKAQNGRGTVAQNPHVLRGVLAPVVVKTAASFQQHRDRAVSTVSPLSLSLSLSLHSSFLSGKT